MAEFVTIKPGLKPDGTPHRVPMPDGYGLPGMGTPLPADGFRVPLDHFIQRLLSSGDAVLVPTPPASGSLASGSLASGVTSGASK